MYQISVFSSAGRCLCIFYVISKAGSRASSVVREAGICVVVVPVISEVGSRARSVVSSVSRYVCFL